MSTAKFTTGYMDNAVFNLDKVVRQATKELRACPDEFDTLVGTGFSGSIVVPMLATRLKKHFVLIRKENDDSHHGSGRLLGKLGDAWIFVDDFSESGKTKERVLKKVAAASVLYDHKTQYMGVYFYQTGIIRESRKSVVAGYYSALSSQETQVP